MQLLSQRVKDWLKQQLPSKVVAGLLHFMASALVLAVFAALAYFVWYPNGLYLADGGLAGSKIILMVDLVLGPLLMMVVFNKAKPRKELMVDIGVIVLLQLAALAYGLYTVYQQRPVALVYDDTAFHTLTLANAKRIPISCAELKKYDKVNRIPMIYARDPMEDEMVAEFERVINDGYTSVMFPKRYQVMAPAIGKMQSKPPKQVVAASKQGKLVRFAGVDHDLWLQISPTGEWLGSIKAPDPFAAVVKPSKPANKQ